MSADFSYDPVTAVDEATATGATADIFADIRATMGIPLITSIWRGLAGMEDCLPSVWALTKPIYLSGLPEGALARVIARANLPLPEPRTPTQLACVGISPRDLDDIRAIVAAYNRSNGMNLVALAALVTPPGRDRATSSKPTSAAHWPLLPPLLQCDVIDEDTWGLIRHVDSFGASGVDAHVATLWRHMAHWPGLLALIHAAFAPLQASGAIPAATAQVVRLEYRPDKRPVASSPGARVRVVRALSVGESREEWDRLVRMAPGERVRRRSSGHGSSTWAAAAQPRACRPPREGR